MLNLLKQEAKVGDILKLYLTTGATIEGTIVEIDEISLVLEVEGNKKRFFPQLIGGWDIDSNNVIPRDQETLHKTNAEGTEVDELDALSLFDNIYENERINLSNTIKTNACVEKVTATEVIVKNDNGDVFVCHRGFMVGFSRANCTSGKRLFCGNPNNTGPQKGICFISVLEMTFDELRTRFISAIKTKPQPRRPIINSIIAYFRNNNNGKSTKKIIQELRNVCSSLNNTDNVRNPKVESLVSSKRYDDAFKLLEESINSSSNDKQKSNLLLRRAQLYSSLKRHDDAINSYTELISFNETIGSPSKNLSHLYTELARLYLLTGDAEQAKMARDNALRHNPQNSIAKNLGSFNEVPKLNNKHGDLMDDSHPFAILKLTEKRLVDDDIEKHTFSDPEIVSLNGAVSNEIADRLLESASVSKDFTHQIEAAKALKELPIGSYNIQDLEETIFSYSILKCRSLFNSYRRILSEPQSLDGIAFESLYRVKDCAIDYYLETIESIYEEDFQTATELYTECLMLELTSLILKTEEKAKVEEVFKFSLEELLLYCKSLRDDVVASFVISIVGYSIKYSGIWESITKQSQCINDFLQYVTNNNEIKQIIIQNTPPGKKRDASDSNFLDILINHERNRLGNFYRFLRKIEKVKFDVGSIRLLQSNCRVFSKSKYNRFFNATDRKTSHKVTQVLSILSNYQGRDKDYQRVLLSNSLVELDDIIKLNNNPNSTKLGRFYFYPILSSWQETLNGLKSKMGKELIGNCQLAIEVDSPFFSEDKNEISFKLVIYNKSTLVAEGYRYAVWTGENRKNTIAKSVQKEIFPNGSDRLTVFIPKDRWGDSDSYELKLAIQSQYLGNWSKEDVIGATISKPRNTFLDTSIKIDWQDSGIPEQGMFKGRDDIVDKLFKHYRSNRRYYTYVLYGLSRTGKTVILHYLQERIEGSEIENGSLKKIILPLFLSLDAECSKGINDFWDRLFESLNTATKEFIKKWKAEEIDSFKKPASFRDYIENLEKLRIHPLFMFDEFSYMANLIEGGVISPSFFQYLRNIASKDKASFIFAGTYDIDSLIDDPRYDISGAYIYLKKRSIFEISKESAEELMNAMHGVLDFTPSAIREMHKLTGDVPYWIQKLCLDCALFAIAKNKPVIGASELDEVVRILVGEYSDIDEDFDVTPLNDKTFDVTMVLSTDTDEMRIVLTCIAHLMKDPNNYLGVSYNQIKDYCWKFNHDISDYKIEEAIEPLFKRKTLKYTDVEDKRLYYFSLDLFRRWWLHEYFEPEMSLSRLFKNINIRDKQ